MQETQTQNKKRTTQTAQETYSAPAYSSWQLRLPRRSELPHSSAKNSEAPP